MPILKNAKKALRVAARKRERNVRQKSMIKTMIDKMKKAANSEHLSSAFSAIDRGVKKNLFHKNKAARMKSQLSKLIASK